MNISMNQLKFLGDNEFLEGWWEQNVDFNDKKNDFSSMTKKKTILSP